MERTMQQEISRIFEERSRAEKQEKAERYRAMAVRCLSRAYVEDRVRRELCMAEEPADAPHQIAVDGPVIDGPVDLTCSGAAAFHVQEADVLGVLQLGRGAGDGGAVLKGCRQAAGAPGEGAGRHGALLGEQRGRLDVEHGAYLVGEVVGEHGTTKIRDFFGLSNGR